MTLRLPSRALFGFLLLCAMLAGCASLHYDPNVEATLAGLHPGPATLTETTVVFDIRIENATPKPLSLQGGVFKLTINGVYLGKGMTGDSLVVERFGSVVKPVEVHLSNLRMASHFREIIASREFSYRLESLLYPTEGRTMGSLREGKLSLGSPSTSGPGVGR